MNDAALSSALKKHFGFDGFLDHQQAVIEQILAGQDLCVVMPTGAGKSLCYQLPALLKYSYALVISPLIALMADQVNALQRRNIPAAFINSTIGFSEQLDAVRRAEAGELKLLYVAPERLQSSFFHDFLLRCPPSCMVVDEAHCISEWGHDFRPSYRKIGQVASAAGIKQICAFTATATPKVCADITLQLQRPEMQLVAAGFRRANLNFKVEKCKGGKDARFAIIKRELADHRQGAVIIYAATRQAVDELTAIPGVHGYHAGMSNEERAAAQHYFMTDPAPVLAATNAFGMGIDRPDVRKVIHYQLPGSLEAYYQEAGRAGRDGESAQCLLLFSYSDRYIQNFLIDMNNPPPSLLRSLYRVLRKLHHSRSLAPGDSLEVTAAELQKLLPESSGDGQITAALGILEKSGAIVRRNRQTGQGILCFTGDLQKLKVLHQLEKTQRSRFIHRMIAEYGETLHKKQHFTIDTLSAVASLNPEQTRRVLNALHGDVLLWENGFAGRAIELVDPECSEPEIDDRELLLHRDYEQSRLDAVIHYAESRNCRQVELIGYFGEKSGTWQCGCCDNCAGTTSSLSEIADKNAVRIALRAAELFNGRLGAVKLAQILAGSRNAGIIAGNWHRNVCFGTLRKLKTSRVEELIRTLLDNGDLERVERGGYPCIRLSAQGREKLYHPDSE